MRIILFIAFFLLGKIAHAQTIINSYAKVTAINGTKTTLTISTKYPTTHNFAANSEVIIIQMQDNVIGNTNNEANFGTIGSIGSAGLYEVCKVQSFSGSTMVLTSPLKNTYNTGANSSVQIVSFPSYNNQVFNYNVTALQWDGNIGGVIALQSTGWIRIGDGYSISANGLGFRGGVISDANSTVECNQSYITSTAGISGGKGEGIYKSTNTNFVHGRAKILNGGGGGNLHNAGGGGGGNYSAGGAGGGGYGCASNPVGGQGGISLSAYSTKDRVFMGGGGGGGHQNNGHSSAGGNGGGIIFIKAEEIRSTGNCGSVSISANGLNALNGSDDGAGGAGAGGTIVLDVASYNLVTNCKLNIQANGGTGGSSVTPNIHGGGGAGGQGRIILSTNTPSNMITATNNGTPGCGNQDNPCTSWAGNAGGTNNSGISTNTGNTPLPVNLLSFEGSYREKDRTVILTWATASERNNSFFTIERAGQDLMFKQLNTLRGQGTTGVKQFYEFEDNTPLMGNNYYRLSQTDHDGTFEYLGVIKIHRNSDGFKITLYPNPVKQNESITLEFNDATVGEYVVRILNPTGIPVLNHIIKVTLPFHTIQLPLRDLPTGLYTFQLLTYDNQLKITDKLIIH